MKNKAQKIFTTKTYYCTSRGEKIFCNAVLRQNINKLVLAH